MNSRSFAKIYEKNVDQIYRFVFLKVNSEALAQDITSETFLRCLKSLKNNSKIDNIRAFLYQIAKNLVIDFYRRKPAEALSLEGISAEFADEKSEDFAVRLANYSELDTVKKALGGLKEDYAEAIILHYLDDLSVPEIAEITGRNEGAVRVILHRGLKSLRGIMNHES